jgi:hypothetical protein
VPPGGLRHRAAPLGQVALGQREPRDEADPLIRAHVEHVLAAAVDEVEAVLDGDDVDDRAGLGELLGPDVRDADVADLALVPQLLQRADRLRVGDLRVGAVVLVEVDAVDLQPAQRALAGGPQVLRVAVDRPLVRAGPLEAALRGDDEVLRVGVQRLGDQLLGDVRPVRVGGVDEVAADLVGAADDGERPCRGCAAGPRSRGR